MRAKAASKRRRSSVLARLLRWVFPPRRTTLRVRYEPHVVVDVREEARFLPWLLLSDSPRQDLQYRLSPYGHSWFCEDTGEDAGRRFAAELYDFSEVTPKIERGPRR